VIVTGVPVGPEDGDKLLIPGVTLKFTLLLGSPATVITTAAAPGPRLAGTGTVTLLLLHAVGETVMPPTVTVLAVCLAPKLVPEIVNDVPTGPETGDRLVIPGATPKLALGLDKPLTVITTGLLPAAKPGGTVATTLVALQLVVAALMPANVTVLLPWLAPKLVPLMVIEAPIGPEAGEKPVIPGVTVKFVLALGTAPTVTMTGAAPSPKPGGTLNTTAVSLQVLGVTLTPPMVTVLAPWLWPKSVPLIVTEVPTGPEGGDNEVIPGAKV
jgi:hypothetical protein